MRTRELEKRIGELQKKVDFNNAIRCKNDGSLDPVIEKAIVAAQEIKVLDLDTRAYSCLTRAGITHIYQICDKTKEQLMNIRNCGESTADHIRDRLEKLGLSLRG